jgi:glycosyltransferase involved in cell wall biosynthesis
MTDVTRVLVQADQLASPAGGGRFLRGLASQLLVAADSGAARSANRIEVTFLSTQRESPQQVFGKGHAVRDVARRLPSRLRGTSIERAWCHLLPDTDVVYGSFSHVFPHPRAARVVTVHDVTFLRPEFHGESRSALLTRTTEKALSVADAVVCTCRSTERLLVDRWPNCAAKTTVVYSGFSLPPDAATTRLQGHRPSLLVVGTIEPRKNYRTILRAFHVLRQRRPRDCPHLTVIGKRGWMCDEEVRGIEALVERGECTWLAKANDAVLWREYSTCSAFTYLPFEEGFGFPPFEAAALGCPLVLSDRSSIGEIWSETARCVDPSDVDAIANAWIWALEMSDSERSAVVDRQQQTVRRFSWEYCCQGYAKVWAESARRVRR